MAGTLGRLALELGISNKELIGGLAEGDAAVGTFESKTTGSMSKVGKSIAALAVVGVIVGLGIASIHSAEQFQSSTASIATNAGITQRAADNIGKAFLSAGNDTLSSGREMADAYGPVAGQLGVLAGHALSAREALGFMDNSARLAEASGGALDSTTQALTTVMKAYTMGLGQSGAASDILFNASRLTKSSVSDLADNIAKLHTKLGEAAPSLKDTATAAVALDQAGAQGRGLMMFSAGITSLLLPSKGTTAEIKSLGLNVYDAQGKFVGMGSIISQLQPKLAGMSSEQRRAAESALFGKTAAELFNNVIAKGPAAYAQLTTAVGQHGTAAAAAALKAQTLEGAHKALNKAVSDAMVTIGTEMIPALNTLAKTALPLVTAGAGFLAHNLGTIAPIVLGVVGVLVAMKVVSLAQAAATGLVTVATTAWTVASGIAKVAQIAWAVITGVATGQVSALAAAQWLLNLALDANPIGVIVLAVVAFVAILVLLYNNVKPVRDAINWLWNEIQILWHWIVGGSPGLVPAFQALIGIIQTVISIALLPIKLEFMALSWAVGVVWNILKGVGGWLASTFGGILSGTIGTIGHIVSTILGEFGKLPGQLVAIGGQIIGGLISGLLGGVGKLAGAVGSVAGSVVNGFKGLLGIHSPSLVFAEQIGRPIVEGIAMGITKSDAAHRALAGLNLAGPNVGGAGRLSGGQGGGMGSGGGMTNYITVNNPTPEPASTSVSRELRKVSYLAQAQ